MYYSRALTIKEALKRVGKQPWVGFYRDSQIHHNTTDGCTDRAV